MYVSRLLAGSPLSDAQRLDLRTMQHNLCLSYVLGTKHPTIRSLNVGGVRRAAIVYVSRLLAGSPLQCCTMYGACDLVNYKPLGASSHMHTSYELHRVDRRECNPLDDLRMNAGSGCSTTWSLRRSMVMSPAKTSLCLRRLQRSWRTRSLGSRRTLTCCSQHH